jgi:hypothetical protein
MTPGYACIRRVLSASAIIASIIVMATTAQSVPADGLGLPQSGVYGCMDQSGNEAVTLQWGLIDGSTYSDFDGGRGKYTYDVSTAVLTFTSGQFKGLQRKRTEKNLFRVLDEHGEITGMACPWTPKDPKKLHW